MLGNRGVDHPAVAEFLKQALGHLVGPLILRDLLAHDIDHLVAAHFLGHGVAQGVAHRLGLGVGEKFLLVHVHHRDRRSGGSVGSRFRRRRRSLARGGRRRCRAGIDRARVLAILEQNRDRRVHRDILGSLGDQDAA